MSEQANEDILTPNPPVEVDTSFAAVMAALAPDEFGEATGEGSDQDAAPAAAAGSGGRRPSKKHIFVFERSKINDLELEG